jgi:hypothetical protein
MSKKIVYLIILFAIINSLMGCATKRIYKSDEVNAFAKDVKLAYPNIERIQVKRKDIEIYVTMWLKNTAANEELEDIFKTTEEHINTADFVNAISKEDKIEKRSFSRATIKVVNPNVDKSKDHQYKVYKVDVK